MSSEIRLFRKQFSGHISSKISASSLWKCNESYKATSTLKQSASAYLSFKIYSNIKGQTQVVI